VASVLRTIMQQIDERSSRVLKKISEDGRGLEHKQDILCSERHVDLRSINALEAV
jgi:hypothetical protein